MLAWTQQNTMQRAMRTVLEWPQSHAISKTINMLTNKSEPQQKCRLGTVSKILLGGLNRFYRRLTSPSASIMATYNCSVFLSFKVRLHSGSQGSSKSAMVLVSDVSIFSKSMSSSQMFKGDFSGMQSRTRFYFLEKNQI